MTDEVQKIRKEIEKRYKYWKGKESNSHSIESEIRMSECQHLLLMFDSLQEEPVSEDLEKAAVEAFKQIVDSDKNNFLEIFKTGANWKKEQINEALLSEVLPCFMHGGEADEVVAKLDEVLNKKKQKEE